MKMAAVHAICELAKEAVPAYIAEAYGGLAMEFGREYIIPKPMDVRLIVEGAGGCDPPRLLH